MAVIYGLVDPDEPDHVRYVGVTLDIEKRRAQYQAGQWSGRRVKTWAERLAAKGRRPVLKVLDVGDPWREAEWIGDLKARGCELLNTAKGGDLQRRGPRHKTFAISLEPNLALLAEEAAAQSARPVDEVIAEALRRHLLPKAPRGRGQADWGPLDEWLEEADAAAQAGKGDALAGYMRLHLKTAQACTRAQGARLLAAQRRLEAKARRQDPGAGEAAGWAAFRAMNPV